VCNIYYDGVYKGRTVNNPKIHPLQELAELGTEISESDLEQQRSLVTGNDDFTQYFTSVGLDIVLKGRCESITHGGQ